MPKKTEIEKILVELENLVEKSTKDVCFPDQSRIKALGEAIRIVEKYKL